MAAAEDDDAFAPTPRLRAPSFAVCAYRRALTLPMFGESAGDCVVDPGAAGSGWSSVNGGGGGNFMAVTAAHCFASSWARSVVAMAAAAAAGGSANCMEALVGSEFDPVRWCRAAGEVRADSAEFEAPAVAAEPPADW